MAGIGIILNPHSRSNRKNPERIKRLGFIVGDKGACEQTQDIKDLPRIAREFKERGIEILGISGGDGTNHCTLTTFINEYGDTPLPKIAFLRGGTMNAIANAINIHGSPEQILSNLIIKYHEDVPFEETEIDLINVNGKYGFLFGNGLVSRFIELYYENKNGPAGAFLLLSKIMGSAIINGHRVRELCERYDAEITVDGKKLGFKNFTLIGAGTVETFNFNFRPLYRARTVPGMFQIFGGSGTPREILKTFPKIFLAKPLPKRVFEDEMAKEVDLHLAEPQTYMIDGDLQPATTDINIKIGPRLTFIIR